MKIRFPKSHISRAFRPFTKPVAAKQKRNVYAFIEVQASDIGSSFDLLEGESGVRPVSIGRYTRSQLAKLSEEQLSELLTLVVPGTPILRVVGFGHALTRLERKGIKFSRAKKRNRRARKSSNSRRNKPSKAKSKKRGSRRRSRH